MASTCPKCHQVIEDDGICCLDVKYTWKCKSCGKLSSGFVVPYGRCFLCGGENEVLQGYRGAQPEQVEIVREAVQYELEMYHFYWLAAAHTTNAQLRGILEDLCEKEQDHLDELEQKYHVHLEPAERRPGESSNQPMSLWIFQGIDFTDPGEHVLAVYDKAIVMERRTRDFYLRRGEAFPPGPHRDVFAELAAEEEEHVSILETEREHFVRP
jgi:rubrerythrin